MKTKEIANPRTDDYNTKDLRLIKGEKKKLSRVTNSSSVKKKNWSNDVTCKDRAKLYLQVWEKNREGWKFQKVVQIWLLKHMFDPNQVSDRTFKRFVKYISESKGQVLQRLKETCEEVTQAMMKLKESGLSEDEIISQHHNVPAVEVKYLRARMILQSV